MLVLSALPAQWRRVLMDAPAKNLSVPAVLGLPFPSGNAPVLCSLSRGHSSFSPRRQLQDEASSRACSPAPPMVCGRPGSGLQVSLENWEKQGRVLSS